MTETVQKTASGAILYDRQVIREISEERFAAAGWLHAEPVSGALRAAGRGNTMFVGNVPRQFVLRHYMRGGLIGKVVRDSYIWTGEDESRPFAEWRMLAKMADSGATRATACSRPVLPARASVFGRYHHGTHSERRLVVRLHCRQTPGAGVLAITRCGGTAFSRQRRLSRRHECL